MVVIALVGVAMLAPTRRPGRVSCGPGTPDRHASLGAVRLGPGLAAGSPGWVAVSVATLWRTPGSVRPVDKPALERPARIRPWLAAMSLAQRRDLGGRADTQALLGDRVRVLRIRGSWAKVVVPDQPTPLDARGYPGWVPTRQLTARRPTTTAQTVTVTSRTAWLRADDATGRKVFEISFGTRLPYLGDVGRSVRVRTPLGVVRRIRAAGVSVHAPADPALPQSRGDLVRTAQQFHGLPYLWAGASGFGLDCSGLVWLDHRAHGIVTPRDSAAQAMHGARVKSGKPQARRPDVLRHQRRRPPRHDVRRPAPNGAGSAHRKRRRDRAGFLGRVRRGPALPAVGRQGRA